MRLSTLVALGNLALIASAIPLLSPTRRVCASRRDKLITEVDDGADNCIPYRRDAAAEPSDELIAAHVRRVCASRRDKLITEVDDGADNCVPYRRAVEEHLAGRGVYADYEGRED